MKNPRFLRKSNLLRAVAVAAMSMAATASMKAADFFNSGGISYGPTQVDLSNAGSSLDSSRWAIFALSGGVTITDPTATASNPNTLDPYFNTDVLGDVGLAGNGKLTMTNSNIDGDVYRTSTSTAALTNQTFFDYYGPTSVNGNYNSSSNNSPLAIKAAAAVTASNNAFGLLTNTGGLTFSNVPGSINTVTNGAGATTSLSLNNIGASISGAANTNYVLNFKDIVLSGASAILNLSGTSTTNYVINVNRYLQLSQQAQITLSGGLTAANVLFNVGGSGTPYDVALSGNSVLNGTILTPNRNVKLTDRSYVYGTVIAKGVSLSGYSHVIQTVSP